MRFIEIVLVLAVLLTSSVTRAVAQSANSQPPQLALVIGISDYDRDHTAQKAAGFATPGHLPNAVADAKLVAEAFQTQGFRVTQIVNPDRRAILTALGEFNSAIRKAGEDAVSILYFAGHGAQGHPALERDIDNYLIPLRADIASEADLDSEAVGLRRISAMLRPGQRGAVILVLDACRDFALPQAERTMGSPRGLAEARAAPGTLIAYSTAPGSVAYDGRPGQNSPFAQAFAKELRSATGTRLEDVLINVRNAVLTETNSSQIPWENSSLRRPVSIGTVLQGGARE